VKKELLQWRRMASAHLPKLQKKKKNQNTTLQVDRYRNLAGDGIGGFVHRLNATEGMVTTWIGVYYMLQNLEPTLEL
jgi:hypothetical protein